MKSKINQLKNHQGFMKYFKNTSWLFGEKVLRIVVGLSVGVWVARYLEPNQFGTFSYAMSFVGLFSTIATLGLDGIVVRELVKDDNQSGKLIGTAFGLKVIGAITMLIIISITIGFTSNNTQTNILIFIIASGTIFQSFNVLDMYFKAKVLSKFVVYSNVISLLISSFIKIILILNEASLIYFAWVVLFDSVVLALGFIYYFFANSKLSIENLVFEKSIAVQLLKDSWPLMLSGGVLMIQARIDQVMIKEMVGVTEVGYYSVALRLVEVFAFVPMMLKNSLYPSIQNAKNTNNQRYQNRLLNYYRLSFLLFLIVAIPLLLFSERIVIQLFGVEYQSAGALLALMSIRLFFANMGVARSSFILTENLMKFSLLTMVLGTVVNIALNYLWIPEYSSKGAVVATIVSFSVTIFLVDVFYSKTRGNILLQIESILTFYKIKLRS